MALRAPPGGLWNQCGSAKKCKVLGVNITFLLTFNGSCSPTNSDNTELNLPKRYYWIVFRFNFGFVACVILIFRFYHKEGLWSSRPDNIIGKTPPIFDTVRTQVSDTPRTPHMTSSTRGRGSRRGQRGPRTPLPTIPPARQQQQLGCCDIAGSQRLLWLQRLGGRAEPSP